MLEAALEQMDDIIAGEGYEATLYFHHNFAEETNVMLHNHEHIRHIMLNFRQTNVQVLFVYLQCNLGSCLLRAFQPWPANFS